MCKNYEKKWESNETKLGRDKKSGNEEFEIIQDRADAPCTSTPEHLEIVVARQPTWMWREIERERETTYEESWRPWEHRLEGIILSPIF